MSRGGTTPRRRLTGVIARFFPVSLALIIKNTRYSILLVLWLIEIVQWPHVTFVPGLEAGIHAAGARLEPMARGWPGQAGQARSEPCVCV